MAGVIAGATGTALTSIVMMIEMTGDLHVAPPVMLCVALAYIVRRSLSRESAYTVKLLRQGMVVPESLHVSMHYFKRADEVMVPVAHWSKDVPTKETRITGNDRQGYGLVLHKGYLIGWRPNRTTAMRKDLIAVSPSTLLEDVLIALDEAGARLAVVVNGELGGEIAQPQVIGVIGADEWLGEELADARLFPHGR
jgi:CIC family chloride channel protein